MMLTLNSIAYIIFILMTVLITVVVGYSLHKNGAVFLQNLFQEESEVMLNINNILLIGYYLLNIGFALYTLNTWSNIITQQQLIESITNRSCILLITLAIIHFSNLIAFFITAKIKKVYL